MNGQETTVAVNETEEKSKRGRKSRDKHPAALADGSLTETPGDFNFELHGRLVIKDFKEEFQFLTYHAADSTFRANLFTEQAEASKALGSSASRKKAKKLVSLRDSMQTLIDRLREQGMDTDKILGVTAAE